MVMNPEDLRKPMSEFDWQVLAHTYRKNGLPTLPRARLDMPLPADLEKAHTLAHMLAALSQQLATEIRLAHTTRSGVLNIKHLINQFRVRFQAVGKEWERELREAEEMAKNSANTGERLRAVE